MLKKAQQIACEQIDMSSCLPKAKYKRLCELPEEEALYVLAQEFLEEGSIDIGYTIKEIRGE